jgi:hypothetical protein
MMTRTTKRTKKDSLGVYAVYWEVEEDKGGYRSVTTIVPDVKEAPNEVKLAIVQSLLADLKIPIRIEEHLIRNGYDSR